MTVFVGVRNNYLIWRCNVHAFCSLMSAVALCYGIATAVQKPTTYVALLPAVAITTKRGRKVAKQCIHEVHDGVLFKLFGVFNSDSSKKGDY
jgi:hypothetical protein